MSKCSIISFIKMAKEERVGIYLLLVIITVNVENLMIQGIKLFLLN